MPFAIIAELPLGTYRAGVGEGQLDRWPSPARLHAAFLSAAGQGVRAVEVDGLLRPSEVDRKALEWLETNAPDGLALPTSHVNDVAGSVYRDIGLLGPKMRGTKRPSKRDHSSVAVAESVVWIWGTEPPPDVAESLEDLCPDVPYLGRSDTPVRLRASVTSPRPATHVRQQVAGIRARRADVDLDAPRRGRTAALGLEYVTSAAAPPPAARHDQATTDERENRPGWVTTGLGRDRYSPVAEVPSRSPWSRVWHLPVAARDRAIAVDEKVGWSVALRRALVSLCGDDAPALLTGHYAEGLVPPANRLAIHVVDRHPAMARPLPSSQAFVVAVPDGAGPAEIGMIAEALAALRVVRSRRGRLDIALEESDGEPVPGGAYWAPPVDGTVRCWTTAPAVAETRPLRGRPWGLHEAVALSIGLVLRDEMLTGAQRALPREERMRFLAREAVERGLLVHDVRRLATSHPEWYVHKVPAGFVVDPYVATLELGDLADPPTPWMAIGQSRHLGGGMLVPVDVAPSVAGIWRHR